MTVCCVCIAVIRVIQVAAAFTYKAAHFRIPSVNVAVHISIGNTVIKLTIFGITDKTADSPIVSAHIYISGTFRIGGCAVSTLIYGTG